MNRQDLSLSRLNLRIQSPSSMGERQYRPEFNVADDVEWNFLSAHGACIILGDELGTSLTGERVVEDCFSEIRRALGGRPSMA